MLGEGGWGGRWEIGDEEVVFVRDGMGKGELGGMGGLVGRLDRLGM